jgi:NitT/TauT family transport system ATP-binding protein
MTREVLQGQLEGLVSDSGQTVVFITHSIDEAILLGDRVAVISNRPGTIREIVDIDLPRPRMTERELRGDHRYGELREHLWNLVKDEALGAATADQEPKEDERQRAMDAVSEVDTRESRL